MRHTATAILVTVGLAGGAAHARTHPQLTPAAAALVAQGFFLVPDDNLAIPFGAKAKAVPFLVAQPRRLELVDGATAPLLVIDDDVYRLDGAELKTAARHVGMQAAASADGALIASLEDKRTLKLTRGDATQPIAYRRPGNWELERPYVTPDGNWVLVAVRDYTAPLDAFDFVVINPKSGEYDEVHLSKNFVPGALRQPLAPTQIAVQMFTQQSDDQGFVNLVETDFAVFDLKQKKLLSAPKGLRPGQPSADGKRSLMIGKMAYSDDKRCGGDATAVYEEGKPPARYAAGDGTVVSALDFLPDGSGVVANVLTLKTCKSRGVIIPFGADEKPSAWKPFALPSHGGHLTGRVIPAQTAAKPPAAAPAPGKP